ncbi:MAG: hypothetical protein K2I03_13875 [Lachnospiraceae bacterium]|nr:hypothetical protein [Lachnospiraceae bacterium]
MAKKKIFTSDEIFNVCKAFAIVEADEDGYLSGEELLSMNDEEACDKIDLLSESDRKKFNKQVDISVQDQLELFRSLPDEVNTEEAIQEHQSIIQEVYNNWVSDFEDFIIDDD